MAAPLLTDSIDIEAPPSEVWAIVSDLRSMGERSPQCRKMWIVGGGDVKLGSRSVNINKQGWKYWPTMAKVVAFEPERKIALKIVDNRTTWSYELEPTASGTRLTESREAPDGVTAYSSIAARTILGGADSFDAEVLDGIRSTLAAIKKQAEHA